ncbi:hypothetical protein EC968_005988 [Mortierella alpina]|nr:hypothetical protein EC968_005988 [Mortierella alpina]
MSQLAAAKVFGIPELLIQVIDQLDKRADLIACAQVHSVWHDAVIPFLYHNVTIGIYHRFVDKSSWDGFQKHSSHMRVLQFDNRAKRSIALFGLYCTNLTHLHFNCCNDMTTNTPWSLSLLKLISHNPGISTLYITSERAAYDATSELYHHLVELGLLRYISGLKKLVIAVRSIGHSSLDEIMRCAHRLEELNVTARCIEEDLIPRPSRPLPDLDFDSIQNQLSLKDHDADVDTHDGPYILDSQSRRCRQGTRLKKFRFVLSNEHPRDVVLADASLLLRVCGGAEYIDLDITGEPTRNRVMQALRDQVGHHAWCLKHLDIGNLRSVDVPVLVEILRASSSLLLSFRLWKSSLTDELLLALSEYHGKTLERLTFGKCPEIFHKDKIEALLSRCPKLQLLHVFNCDKEDDFCMTVTEERPLRWVGPDGKMFKIFTADKLRPPSVSHARKIPLSDTTMDDGIVCDDPWVYLDLMRKLDFQSHIRFVADCPTYRHLSLKRTGVARAAERI